MEIDSQTDFFVAELGMRGKGQIEMLSRICNLDIGTITAVGESHMAFFKDLREIAIAKAEIAEILYKNNGILFLNNDDRYTDLIEKKVNCRIIKFGKNNNIAFNFVAFYSNIMPFKTHGISNKDIYYLNIINLF